MEVTAELSITPVGAGLSFSDYIAECEKILKQNNLNIQLHAEGTNIEGDMETVLSAIQQCIASVHKLGAPRIITNVKINSRTDKNQSLNDKVRSVESKM